MDVADYEKPSRTSPAFFASMAIAGLVYATLALLLMHFLRPDYTPVDHMISDYAVGRYGWIMASFFLAAGCAILMLMLGLAGGGPTSLVARIGTYLLVVPGIGMMVSAFFPTDLETATVRTAAGRVHDIGFLVNVLAIFLAIVLLSIGFDSHPRWRSHQRTAIALTGLIVLAFVLQFLTLHRGAPYGIANRFFITVLFAWLLATAIRLRALARE